MSDANGTALTDGPLTGMKIMEMASLIMVPYAGQLLADLGAQIIKVESPEGDGNRFMGDGTVPGLSGVAMNLHRNKRSISVDLKHPDAGEIVRRILGDCDAMITNLRPGSLHRMGLAYEDLSGSFPNLVYCEAHGFRTDSPEADFPALDDTIQALCGVPALQMTMGLEPRFVPTLLADKVAGMTIAYAVLAALLARVQTGRGQRVEVPMFDSLLAFVLTEHLARAAFPGGQAGYSRIMTLNRGPHPTKDGWIAMMPYTGKQWQKLYEAVGEGHLMNQPWHADMAARLTYADRVYAELREVVAQKTTEEWLDICRELDVPASPIPHISEVVEDPLLHHGVIRDAEHPIVGSYRDIRPPVIFDDTQLRSPRTPAPLVGGNGIELMQEASFSAEEIARFADDGAINVANAQTVGDESN